eukprot:gene349-982_t
MGRFTPAKVSQENQDPQNECVMCLYQKYYETVFNHRYRYQNVYSNGRLMQRQRARKQLWRPWVDRNQSEPAQFTKETPNMANAKTTQNDYGANQAPLEFQHPVK